MRVWDTLAGRELRTLQGHANPVIAVALGWLFYREPFGVREALAMVIVFAGVAIVKRTAPTKAH